MLRFDSLIGAMLMSLVLRRLCVTSLLLVFPTSLLTAQKSSKKKNAPPQAASAAPTAAAETQAKKEEDPLFKGLTWRLVGPFRGGRVLAVSGVVGEPNTYYFGGVGGGVWKTTDGGLTWRPITDKVKEMAPSIGAIAVAPSDANTIYAGTGEACI